MTRFDLRPATELDYELMWTIQRTAIGPYVDITFGTSGEFQRAYFDQHFDHLDHQIVQIDGGDAGFLSFQLRETHMYLGNLALMPDFQNRGIGGEIIRYVIAQAEAAHLPVRLQVLKSNPARRFYERFGFSCCGETETHVQMLREIGLG